MDTHTASILATHHSILQTITCRYFFLGVVKKQIEHFASHITLILKRFSFVKARWTTSTPALLLNQNVSILT